MPSSKPRLLIISPDYAPAMGGVEKFVKTIAHHLPSDNFAVKILAGTRLQTEISRIQEDVIDNIPVVRIPTKAFFGLDFPKNPLYYSKIWRELRTADIIHLNDIRLFFNTVLLGKLFYKYKIVLTSNGLIFHNQRYPWAKKLYTHYFIFCLKRFFNKIIAIGTPDQNFFHRHGVKCELIEDGVDLKKYQNIVRMPQKNYFLYFGRIDKNKNLSALLNVLATYRSLTTEDFKLYICGTGPEILLQQLQQQAKLLNLAEHIVFCGRVSDDTLQTHLSRAEFVFLPTTFESFGYTLIEALSTGCTVIANDIPQFKFIIGNSLAASLVDFAHPNAVIEKMDALRNQYQPSNQTAIMHAQHYDESHMINAYVNLFQTYCHSRN